MSTRPAWMEREAARLREDFKTKTVEKDGVLYWKKSGNVIPPCVFKDADLPYSEKQIAAADAEMDKLIAERRAEVARMTPEERAERTFELRAAFGVGQKIVNILTGEVTKT